MIKLTFSPCFLGQFASSFFALFGKIYLMGFAGMVKLDMISPLHKLKIFNAIVETVFIYMMNNLTRAKRPFKVLRHYIAMLKNFVTVYANIFYSISYPTKRGFVFISLKFSRFFNSQSLKVIKNTSNSKDFSYFGLGFVLDNIKVSQDFFKAFVVHAFCCLPNLAKGMWTLLSTRFTVYRFIPYCFSAFYTMIIFVSHDYIIPLIIFSGKTITRDYQNSNHDLLGEVLL